MKVAKTKCELVFPVYEFRPILDIRYDPNNKDLFRYADGEWISDDGEYDVAFACPGMNNSFRVYIPSREYMLWKWAKNGQWGSFVNGHPRGNAWHYMLRDGEDTWGECWNKYKHLNETSGNEAMDFVTRKMSCCSGRGPEFHINDSYIAKGLLRVRDTKEIVTFPEIFNCMYCGEIDWRKEEDSQ